MLRHCLAALLVAALAGGSSAQPIPPTTAFTYQGRLTEGGQAFNGTATMMFGLYDAPIGGNPVGVWIGPEGVPVAQGLFTAELDFGAGLLPELQGRALWLEIVVNGVHLSPRQALGAAPRALHATTAREAANRFTITGRAGSLALDTGDIRLTGDGLGLNFDRVYIGDANEGASPKMLQLSIGVSDPYIALDPAVGPGLLLGGSEAYLGGPDTVAPTLYLGGIHDPELKYVRGEGSVIIGADTVAIGDVNEGMRVMLRLGRAARSPHVGFDPALGGTGGIDLGFNHVFVADVNEGPATLHFGTELGDPYLSGPNSNGRELFFNNCDDLTLGGPDTAAKTLHFGGGPSVGTDPNVAGIIIIGGRDFTIGGPGDTGPKTLHFGNEPRNPTPFIGSLASNANILALNASSSIRLDGSFVGVGLASTAAPQFRLDLPNTAGPAGQGRANAWTTYSSRRWKENIRPIEGALDKIGAIEGVSFDWKPEHGGSHDIGFVAEDVAEVLPELVEMEEDGAAARSLKYDRMSALAIQGIKEQQRQIDQLRASLSAQGAIIAAQAKQIAELTSRLNSPRPAGAARESR